MGVDTSVGAVARHVRTAVSDAELDKVSAHKHTRTHAHARTHLHAHSPQQLVGGAVVKKHAKHGGKGGMHGIASSENRPMIKIGG